MELISCDTFVCLPPNTLDNKVIFGKNSDRPQGEVQEIIFHGRKSKKTDKLKCTYIEIDETEESFAVILSKPSWMWGAEIGANEFGVVIGNEAVWTKLMNSTDDLEKRLLGMDLVRLGLERGKTAQQAMNVITDLLGRYGQGGPCSDTMLDFTYHNSFLIADSKEAWVLETVGNSIWAAEKIESGFRNISNDLSIGTKIDASSHDLQQTALKLKVWNGTEPFHFAQSFSANSSIENKHDRFSNGRQLLEKYSKDSKFDLRSMMKILRDEPSGICRGCDDEFPSTSSQVSVLMDDVHCHWFTGTVDPGHSIFKPFRFGPKNGTLDENIKLTNLTASPAQMDTRHELYKVHESIFGSEGRGSQENALTKGQRDMEERLIQVVENDNVKGQDNAQLFNSAVEEEIALYKNLVG